MCHEPFFHKRKPVAVLRDQCGRPPPPEEEGCDDPIEPAGIEDPAELPMLRPPPQPLPPPEELPPEYPPPTRAGAGVIAGRAGTGLCSAVLSDVVVCAAGRLTLARQAVASLTLATSLCAGATAFVDAAATWPEFTKRCSAGSYMIVAGRAKPACLVVKVLAGSVRETGTGAAALAIFPATKASAGRCFTTDTFSPVATATGDAMAFPATGYTP